MKKIILIAVVLLAFSCKNKSDEPSGKEEKTVTDKSEEMTSEEMGQIIFEGKGACISCHRVNEKLIGPSVVEIAKMYKEQNASIVGFLKEEHEAIVDPSQYEVMKANLAMTKHFTDKELEALEAYMYSTLE